MIDKMVPLLLFI